MKTAIATLIALIMVLILASAAFAGRFVSAHNRQSGHRFSLRRAARLTL